MSHSYFISLKVAQKVSISKNAAQQTVDREQFYAWLWDRFSDEGLIGVHEGTLLSEEAAQQGLETDSWTIDSGEAPRDRDWVGNQTEGQAELYFSTRETAEKAARSLQKISGIQVGAVQEQKNQDWDALWKASFLNEGCGVEVPPFWRIVPPWVDSSGFSQHERLIRINPGAGFGTGTHETTQLCLQAIGEYSKKTQLNGSVALDFGSGSGILSIAMALQGAQVDGIEIDPLAVDNARENAALNQVEKLVSFVPALQGKEKRYPWVVANILRPVLLAFADSLVERLSSGSVLILSGLIASDVDSVVECYRQKLQVPVTQIYEKGEWRAVVFVR